MFLIPMPSSGGKYSAPPLKAWWVIWVVILGGLVTLYAVVGRGPLPARPSPNPLVDLTGLVPLFVSIIIRWLVLPCITSMLRAWFMFVAGLVLAESCGILGLFLGGPYRDSLFLLGVLGVTQYVPFFAKQYLEPKPQGFYPNN